MAKRILAVDDSASVRQVEKFVLSGAGYEVVEARDGQEALSRLTGGPFNLILTDLNMPNLDGLGLIRSVRANAAHRLTPIVMITTESDDGKKREGKAAGATGWIVKPFSPDQLLAVVKKVLG
jgi:two-component system chemotaxis response regulator CheY